jgi:hypothetical protein
MSAVSGARLSAGDQSPARIPRRLAVTSFMSED